MKHVVAPLVVALVSLFSLSACIEKDILLGSAMVPTNQDISIKTATFDLPVDLRMADSLQSSVSQSITLGAIRTDTFGLFRSESAMTVTAAVDSIEWGRNPVVRRIYLTLTRDTTLTIDPAQLHAPQNLYVHELRTQLDSTHRYNNSLTAADYDPENLMLGNVPYMGEDSYTVDLKKEYGEQFFRIPMEKLDSAELMMKELFGLYLTCDDPVEPLEGGRLNVFDLSGSGLYLMYEYDDEDGNRKSSTAVFQLGQYHTVNITSSGARDLVTDNPGKAIYMEGLSGIKPHITASRLYRQISGWAEANGIPLRNLLIAKATIEFPFEFNGDPAHYDTWSGNMFPVRRVHNDGILSYGPIQEIYDSYLESGNIDRSNLTYKSNISLYLQSLIRKEAGEITEEDDLWMMPTVSATNSYTSEVYYYADYYFYRQNYLNGTGALRHPVLKLTYSVLK